MTSTRRVMTNTISGLCASWGSRSRSVQAPLLAMPLQRGQSKGDAHTSEIQPHLVSSENFKRNINSLAWMKLPKWYLRPGVNRLYPRRQICLLPIFVKSLIAAQPCHACTHHPRLLLSYDSRVEYLQLRMHGLQSLKDWLSGSLQTVYRSLPKTISIIWVVQGVSLPSDWLLEILLEWQKDRSQIERLEAHQFVQERVLDLGHHEKDFLTPEATEKGEILLSPCHLLPTDYWPYGVSCEHGNAADHLSKAWDY